MRITPRLCRGVLFSGVRIGLLCLVFYLPWVLTGQPVPPAALDSSARAAVRFFQTVPNTAYPDAYLLLKQLDHRHALGLNPFMPDTSNVNHREIIRNYRRLMDFSLAMAAPPPVEGRELENLLLACLHCDVSPQTALVAEFNQRIAIELMTHPDGKGFLGHTTYSQEALYGITHQAMMYGWLMELGCDTWLPENLGLFKAFVRDQLAWIYQRVGPTDLGIEALAVWATWYSEEPLPKGAVAEMIRAQCDDGGWAYAHSLEPSNHHATSLALWLLLTLGAQTS